MNKIAVYLNEHLLGEVSGAKSLRKKYATDKGILSVVPELVVFPRVTNDVRKVARFTWQLAEKGHTVGVTTRGEGKGVTGAAIGKGVVVDMSRHLRSIIQIAPKDKLVHVQAGASLSSLYETLKWQGLTIAGVAADSVGTVGGAIAEGSSDGPSLEAIDRLEIVLANGDTIETGRVSRRDVSKKLGLQTLEGEIYRKLEGLMEDSEEAIKQMADDDTVDTAGYKRIAEIRARDGSFDLTPLFIGSQGTLGIISEVVLKADFYSADNTYAVVTTDSMQTARDLTERLSELDPAELSVFDGELFRRAAKNGTKFAVLGDVSQIGAVVYIRFNDFSDRQQAGKLKKMRKLLAKAMLGAVDSTERPVSGFEAITSVARIAQLAGGDDTTVPPVIHGAYVPVNRREDFETSLAELASKHHSELPVSLNALTGVYNVFPILKLTSVGDKQKLFKLLNDYAVMIDKCEGAFTSNGAEGRLKAAAAWSVLDPAHAEVYSQLRAIFDPFGTLNPGVKQKNELRSLVAMLRPEYDSTNLV